MSAAVAKISPPSVQPILVPRTFEQLITFADLAATSGLVPAAYANKPGAVMIAVQMGSELGLSPMQSITSIAVIGNRPGVFGDALIGICRQSPLCQDIVETISGEDDARTAECVATRRGATPCTSRFSVADAKKAGLWGKSGPWTQYPDRMLQHRARGWALRDAFPDLLRGLKTVEELADTPPDNFRGTTLEAEASPEGRSERATPEHKAPPVSVPDKPAKRSYRQIIDETAGMLSACEDLDAVVVVAELPAVLYILEHGNATVKDEINALLAAAFARHRTEADPKLAEAIAADDPFPGDRS